MSSPDIFLSYSREDSARAKQFAEALAREGFTVWWDAHLRSGEDYDKVTEAALKTAKAVVVLWSKHSVESRWVRSEAAIGLRNGALAPAMIEPCDRPVMFELVQTAELAHWKGNNSDKAWQAFVEDLRKFSGAEPPTAAPVTAAAAKRRSWAIAAAGAVLLALMGGAWFVFGGGGGTAFPASSQPIPVLVRGFAPVTEGNTNEAALAIGITDELINRLRRVPGLMVASGRDMIAGSAEAGERNSIEGNVRLAGERVRVSVRLADARGNVLWSENFDRQLTDLFQVQEDIAGAVAQALSVSLDVGRDSRAYGGTGNPEAYAHYLQGSNPDCLPDCSGQIAHLERAIALDPKYAKALAQLSNMYGFSAGTGSSPQEVKRVLALQGKTSAGALEARPDLWIGPAARSWYLLASGNPAEADQLQRQVAKMDPGNDPDLKGNMAIYAAQLGRVRKGIELVRSKELIDPVFRRDPARIGYLVLAQRYGEAEALYRDISTGDPSVAVRDYGPFGVPVGYWAIWAYFLDGQPAKAKEIAKSSPWLMQIVSDMPIDGRGTQSLPDLPPDRLKAWAEQRFGPIWSVETFSNLIGRAQALAADGRHATALAYVDLAYRNRIVGGPYHILWHPVFAEVRKLPGFAKLVTDLGLVKAWRESGDWGDFCRPVSDTEFACK